MFHSSGIGFGLTIILETTSRGVQRCQTIEVIVLMLMHKFSALQITCSTISNQVSVVVSGFRIRVYNSFETSSFLECLWKVWTSAM